MGCTASTQTKTTAQSPQAQTANASNTSPKNDSTPADSSHKQENQVQPLAASSVPEEPAKPGRDNTPAHIGNIFVTNDQQSTRLENLSEASLHDVNGFASQPLKYQLSLFLYPSSRIIHYYYLD